MNVTNFSNEDFDKPLVNRVANSGLITLDLEKYYPKSEILEVDLKDFLFRELLLKEKDFREHVANFDWSKFEGRHVAVHCSTDALIQQWAFMLIAKGYQSCSFLDLKKIGYKMKLLTVAQPHFLF